MDMMLDDLNLPDLFSDGVDWEKRRIEIREILEKEYMGTWPKNVEVIFTEVENDNDFFGGKAILKVIKTKLKKEDKEFCFDFKLVYPKSCNKKLPCFAHINFNDSIADGLGEEIIDNGYAIATVNYQNIEPDVSKDSKEGLQGFLDDSENKRWGKIGVWAFGASKIIDYLISSDLIDKNKIAVIGHSRLGLAAAWCGAMDERVTLTICNNNGALYRATKAESYLDLAREYTRYWFSPRAFINNRTEKQIPFDMHFMHALIAPRFLYLSGANRDQWADADAMLLSAKAATPAFELYGKNGLVDKKVQGERVILYHEGNIGYHLRFGTHYLGRDDWRAIIEYRKKHEI